MARRRKRRRQRCSGDGLVSMALGLGLAIIFITTFNVRMRPILREQAHANVQNQVIAAINEAVSASLERGTPAYSDMITMQTDEQGQVKTLYSNSAALNRLRSEVTAAALDAVNGLDCHSLGVPIGNLTGAALLYGWGPSIRVRALSTGVVEAAFENEFIGAGINQTAHRILLNIAVNVMVRLPGERLETPVTVTVCIAETIIVGAVPEQYIIVENEEKV